MNASPITEQITHYWTQRAHDFHTVRLNELRDAISDRWLQEMGAHLPPSGALDVLDAGTGTGYFAILLAKASHRVTGIDLTCAMLAEAEADAKREGVSVRFARMDAQATDFPDAQFDAVVTRNLTWTLPDPEKAYREWHRLLRPGGVLLNFDANWYHYLVDEEKQREHDRDRENTRLREVEDHEAYPDAPQMEDISRRLPMTMSERPQWDVDTLLALGFSSVAADPEAGRAVWNEEEAVNYASTPGFMIRAVK